MTKKEQPASVPPAQPEPVPAQAPAGQAQAIATPEEVLAAFTAMLRGQGGEKPAEQLRAAEQLAKHYGILSPREEAAPVKAAIAGEIEAAIRSLEGASPPPAASPLPDALPPPAASPRPEALPRPEVSPLSEASPQSASPEVSVDGQDGP